MSDREHQGFPSEEPEWARDEKAGPMLLAPPPGRGGVAAAVTRTAGSIMLIALMLGAVVITVVAFLMQFYYRHQIEAERQETPAEMRELVSYRDDFAVVNDGARQSRYALPGAPPAAPDAQLMIDQLRRDNADLRALNENNRRVVVRGRNPPSPAINSAP